MAKPNPKMEKKRKWLLDLFKADELVHLPDQVLKVVMDSDYEIYDQYLQEYPDLTTDTLQEFFETYFADRTFMNQDFTPPGVAKLMAELTGVSQEVLDECAGIGSLIIQQWNVNHNMTVYARELSAGTIPFLLFNLSLRNMQGIVVRGNTLTLETFNVYLLNKGEKYSKVTEIDLVEEVKKIDPLIILRFLQDRKRL